MYPPLPRTARLPLRAMLALTLGLCLLAAPSFASPKYEMEQQDAEQERREYVVQLRRDREKIDLAVRNTKTLIDRSRGRPYLPELYLRLAELYVEKSRVVYFIRKAESPAGVGSLTQLESNTLKQQAIEVYHRILGNFPDFRQRDKIHFFLAHEYKELGEVERAVAEYMALIRENRDSRYVPEAYLLLGDHYFHAQELELAKRHYQAVLDWGENPALPVARYKLAWCYINDADFATAIRLFEEAVVSAGNHGDAEIDTYRKVDVRLESLIDMAYCYCEQYKEATPQEAVEYFERYAWNRPALIVAMEKLANRYFIKNRWAHSAAIYRKLGELQNDGERLLEYADRVFHCVQSDGSFESADRDLELIVKALRKQRYSIHVPAERKAQRLHDYELYARDIVTHLHLRAQEQKALEPFRVAASAYRTYLEFFEESPERVAMTVNYAETLFSAEQFFRAGRVYEELAEDPELPGRDLPDVLYGAVLSYYSALKEIPDLDPYQKVYARAGLRTTGKAYATAYPDSDKVSKVLFNVAWVAYEEGRYAVAVEEFKQFVKTYPHGNEVEAAIHLVLDAYHLLEDYEALIAYGHRVLAEAPLSSALRVEVQEIVIASESKLINPLTLAAADDWETGKERLLAFAEEHGGSSLGEQALLSLVASSSELQDLEALLSNGWRFLERYPDSAEAEATLNLLIDTCVQTSQFRLLAGYLEEFARRYPHHGNTPEFLHRAARIRLSLGQFELAGQNQQQLRDRKKGDPATLHQSLLLAEKALHSGDRNRARDTLLRVEPSLSGQDAARAAARLAYLGLLTGDAELAAAFGEKARARYAKLKASAGPELKDAVAALEYSTEEPGLRAYLELQLGDTIDNAVVKQKGEQLTQLVQRYHRVMELGSPRWALAGCYRAHEIHIEFAEFLRRAPLPDGLSPEQQARYRALVEEKAAGYAAKGKEYLDQFEQLAAKWEICDPDLADQLGDSAVVATARRPRDPVVGDETVDPGAWLQEPSVTAAHEKLLEDPRNIALRTDLAAAYLRSGDPRHAALIAQAALEESSDGDVEQKASLYNTLGVSRLYTGDDQAALHAFKQALENRPEHRAARVNLAGLYQFYRYSDKAAAIYRAVGPSERLEDGGEPVHPRSRELYDAYRSVASR